MMELAKRRDHFYRKRTVNSFCILLRDRVLSRL